MICLENNKLMFFLPSFLPIFLPSPFLCFVLFHLFICVPFVCQSFSIYLAMIVKLIYKREVSNHYSAGERGEKRRAEKRRMEAEM